jgi:hypothetical protein
MQPTRFSKGTSCKAADGTSLTAIRFSGSISDFSVDSVDLSKAYPNFPGVPCQVRTNDACYLAWSNGTHYLEEGNYQLDDLTHLPGCPDCSRAPPRTADGACSRDGSVTCAAGRANYRCFATRVPGCAPKRLVGTWSGSCTSHTGMDSRGDAVCSDRPCEQPYE